MHLITLEGLPTSCAGLLKIMPAILPSPSPPAVTNHKQTLADDIVMVFSNALARSRSLQRQQTIATHQNRIACGAHWIDLPPGISQETRSILHSLEIDISRAVCEAMNIHVSRHTVLLIKSSIHECFESLVGSMESRDYTLGDLMAFQDFLGDVIEKRKLPPGPFKRCQVYSVECPPFVNENHIDMLFLHLKVQAIIDGL